MYIILSVSEEIDNLSIFCGLHFTYVIFYLRYFLLLSSVGFYLTTLVFCRSFFLLNFGKYHNFVFNKSETVLFVLCFKGFPPIGNGVFVVDICFFGVCLHF